jgi:glycerol-3-phosphate dehydrogenase
LSRYGTKALHIACHQNPWGPDDCLPDSSDYSLSEIDYILRNECVEHLSDIVMRRTTLAICGSLTRNDLERIATAAAQVLSWNSARTSEEIAAVFDELNGRNLMRLA